MSYISEVIIYQNGKPSSGRHVALGFKGLFGGVTKDCITDSNGTARIEHESNGNADIYINGNQAIIEQHLPHLTG
jgi:hypothetical protein